ncbi:MAG: hypothetical protein JWO82_734 [Akkermansiaceae bacterium]|nr:hypothetical protein [Akkermansiaceae bacterium]
MSRLSISLTSAAAILTLAGCSTETPLDQTIPGSRHSPMRGETQYLEGYGPEPVGMRTDTAVVPRNTILTGGAREISSGTEITGGGESSGGELVAPTSKSHHNWPTAEAISGRPGMAKSPYTGEVVDVAGLRSGSLASDPTAPATGEKKYFRVP